MFILHMAVVLFPFVNLVTTGNWTRFIFTVLAVLVPLYGAAFFLVFACQGRHGENWRAGLERVLRPVPILGVARRDLALSRLAAALEALLNAGVSIIYAWELAGAASGSPALRRLVQTWRPRLDQGATPSQLVSESSLFPSVFNNLYHTGEISGQLDETLRRLHALYEEEGLRRMRLAGQWGPRLVYFGVMFYCACRIIFFYLGYFQQLQDTHF
jgi:type II secretory pathway component PulF